MSAEWSESFARSFWLLVGVGGLTLCVVEEEEVVFLLLLSNSLDRNSFVCMCLFLVSQSRPG